MTFWENRRVLVTGISGYLSRGLVKELASKGSSILGVDLRPLDDSIHEVSFEQGDLTDVQFVTEILSRYQIQTCFHLAGQAGVSFCEQHPQEALKANCQATWGFLEGCRSYGKLSEIVVTSSNHIYGHQTVVPTPENAPLNGKGMYATSKVCADVIARSYAYSYGLPTAVARITNTFGGPDPHVDHLITGTILSVLRGQRPVIKGNGTAIKGFLYIQDTIEALIHLAERLRERSLMGEAFNFVPSAPSSVLDIVHLIARLIGAEDLKPHVLGDQRMKEETEHLSNQRAQEMLGWRPKFSLQDGLLAAIRDCRMSEMQAIG